ncbi:MAG: hypothetical protein MK210_06365 [Dehalococcoidia bacterium]|nr:hypothetical protein [Dehalococcoidia bacterium]
MTLVDTLAAGMTIVANPAGGTLVGNVITWNLGTVAANSSTTVSVTVQTTN